MDLGSWILSGSSHMSAKHPLRCGVELQSETKDTTAYKPSAKEISLGGQLGISIWLQLLRVNRGKAPYDAQPLITHSSHKKGDRGHHNTFGGNFGGAK